jgi:hypothetical protein
MEKPGSQVGVNFIDNPHAAEIFASFMTGAAFDGPNIRMTFASSRVNHESNPGPVNNVVNARLIMSIQSAQGMVDFLQRFLASAQLNATERPPESPLN